jgi:hypothetical protein
VLDEYLAPGVFLLAVVDGQQGLLSLRHPAVSVSAIRRRLSP